MQCNSCVEYDDKRNHCKAGGFKVLIDTGENCMHYSYRELVAPHWILDFKDGEKINPYVGTCSVCRGRFESTHYIIGCYHYCPNCGAKMEELND